MIEVTDLVAEALGRGTRSLVDSFQAVEYNSEIRVIVPSVSIGQRFTDDDFIKALLEIIEKKRGKVYLSHFSFRVDREDENLYRFNSDLIQEYLTDHEVSMTQEAPTTTPTLVTERAQPSRQWLSWILSLNQKDRDTIQQVLDSADQLWIIDCETNMARLGNQDGSVLPGDRPIDFYEMLSRSRGLSSLPFFKPQDYLDWTTTISQQSLWYGSWVTRAKNSELSPAKGWVKNTATVQQIQFCRKPHRLVLMHEVEHIGLTYPGQPSKLIH